MLQRLLTIILSSILLVGCDQTEPDFIDKTPAPVKAEIYMKDTISTNNLLEYPITFSDDYTLAVYGGMTDSRERHLMLIEKTDDIWLSPEKISFTGRNEMEPIYSSENNMLIFAADSEDKPGKPHNLYYVLRKNNEWSEPIAFPETINTSATEYYGSITDEGKLYFTREGLGIYSAEGKKYETVNRIVFPSSYIYASHPYISPDDTFILFDARGSNGEGSADLYIAFKNEEGFDEPINLGPNVNSTDWDTMASLSPDGSVLFFVRESGNERDIYWVKFNVDDYK